MSTEKNQVDVLVIGGGPVGLALAIDLALRGISVCVVEKYLVPQRVPKGQNLTQRSGEHLRAWGVSQAIRQASPIPVDYGNEGLTAYGTLLSGYHYDWFKRASVGEFYAADNERLPQYETEKVLRARAQELPGLTLEKGWTYQSHEEGPEGICCKVQESDGPGTMTLHSRYLVGCDGSRSAVRDAAGITQTQDNRDRRMVLLVFNSPQLHTVLDSRFPGKTIFNTLHPALQGYWQFLGRVDLANNWFFHAPVDNDTTLEEQDFHELLARAIGRPLNARIDYAGYWNLRFSHADTYRSGCVFIAGDAAHSHPPYGGYGINTGFEDARNLAWKLAAALQGWGSGQLLDSYTLERHPVFASTRDDFIARMIDSDARFTATYDPQVDANAFCQAWSSRAAGGQAEVSQFVPHYAGSPLVDHKQGARSGAKGLHQHKALAGHHLSPQLLDDNSLVYERLSGGFSLLVVLPPGTQREQCVVAFAQAAGYLNVPLTIIKSSPTIDTGRWEASVILVRPDHFVAVATNNVTTIDPLKILKQAIAHEA